MSATTFFELMEIVRRGPPPVAVILGSGRGLVAQHVPTRNANII